MSLIKEYYVGKTENLSFTEDNICPCSRPAWIYLENGEKDNIRLLKVQTKAGRFFYLPFFGSYYLPENSRKEEVLLYYDKVASSYEKDMRNHSQIGEYLLKKIRSIGCDFKEILSVGAGTGIELEDIAKNYPQITLLDISDKMLQIAKKKPVFHASKFITADFLDYNFKDKRYDVIVCCLAIHYFSGKDLDGFIKKIYSILNDGGFLLWLISIYRCKTWKNTFC